MTGLPVSVVRPAGCEVKRPIELFEEQDPNELVG